MELSQDTRIQKLEFGGFKGRKQHKSRNELFPKMERQRGGRFPNGRALLLALEVYYFQEMTELTVWIDGCP